MKKFKKITYFGIPSETVGSTLSTTVSPGSALPKKMLVN